MFGWRRRIGYISPGTISEQMYDFYRIAPDGVGLVAVGARIGGWSKDEYAKNLSQLEDAAAYLARWNVHMIVHAGAPMIATQGTAFMKDLVQRLSAASGGLPAATALLAATEGMRWLEADRIGVVTPFPQETHDAVAAFVREEGFDVPYDQTMALTPKDFFNLHEIGARQAFDFVVGALRRAKAAGAEVGYVPCPQWHVFEMVKELEDGAGMPVITSNGGDYWYAFKTLGITDVRPGNGVLLDRLIRSSRVRVPDHD